MTATFPPPGKRFARLDGAERIASGTGPGPRNVLVRLPDGKLTVVPAGRWRWRPREEKAKT